MSHAFIIVALSPEDIKGTINGTVEEAVAYQMEPFNENDSWFADGSRWDWWTIGGRYSGRLLGRNEILRSELDEAALTAFRRERFAEVWDQAAKDEKADDNWRSLAYGIEPGETRESFIAKGAASPLTASAFLKDCAWKEGHRMGWFGMPARTECNMKSIETTGEEYTGRCIHECEGRGVAAKIISFEDGDNDQWNSLFFARFIRNLPPETLLVGVDYHV